MGLILLQGVSISHRKLGQHHVCLECLGLVNRTPKRMNSGDLANPPPIPRSLSVGYVPSCPNAILISKSSWETNTVENKYRKFPLGTNIWECYDSRRFNSQQHQTLAATLHMSRTSCRHIYTETRWMHYLPLSRHPQSRCVNCNWKREKIWHPDSTGRSTPGFLGLKDECWS